MTYTRKEWEGQDKVLVARLIDKKRHKAARDYVHALWLNVDPASSFAQYLSGVLFPLEFLARAEGD